MKSMMAQKGPFHPNLKALSEKAPEIAWQVVEGGVGLLPWTPFIQKEKVCFVIGIAKGLEVSLKGDCHLVFLDWEIEHVSAFLASEGASKLLALPNVHFALLDKEVTYQLLQGLFGGLSAEVKIHPAYQKDPRAKEAALRLLADSKTIYWAHEELLHYPHTAALHLLENLKALPHSHDGSCLFGKFPKVPAIICGAGPSLDKAIPYLERLREKGLIFAPGSALNALSSHGLIPHFGAGLDPYQAPYERVMTQSLFEVPFFYNGRLLPKARAAYSGPLLYVPGCEHPLSQWIDRKLCLGKGQVAEGPGVVPFSTELARLMGCDPIIYVGMDLAYTQDRLYANGVGDIRTLEEVGDKVFCKGLLTEWKWIEEANWLSNYAKAHPEITFFNASGGGLGFKDIVEKPLEAMTWEEPQHLLEEEIKKYTQKGITGEEGLEEQFWESVDRSLALLGEMQGSQGGRRALYEVELEEEIAYQTYLTWPKIALKSKIARGQKVDGEALFVKLLTLMKDGR